MTTKPNRNGEQNYIPAGNGDKSGEYTFDSDIRNESKKESNKNSSLFTNAFHSPVNNKIINNFHKLGITIKETRGTSNFDLEKTIYINKNSLNKDAIFHEIGHSMDGVVAKYLSKDKIDYNWFSNELSETMEKYNDNKIPDEINKKLEEQRLAVEKNVKAKLTPDFSNSIKAKVLENEKVRDKPILFQILYKEALTKEITKMLNDKENRPENFDKWACLSDMVDNINKGRISNKLNLIGKHPEGYYNESMLRVLGTGFSIKANSELLANFTQMKLGNYIEQLDLFKKSYPELYDKLDGIFNKIANEMEKIK